MNEQFIFPLIEIIKIVLGSGGVLGLVFIIFRTGKIVQKVENIEAELKSHKTDMKSELTTIKELLSQTDTRVSRIEGYLMGPQILKKGH